MRFVKRSFFVVCAFLVLGILVSGCMQIISAQTQNNLETSRQNAIKASIPESSNSTSLVALQDFSLESNSSLTESSDSQSIVSDEALATSTSESTATSNDVVSKAAPATKATVKAAVNAAPATTTKPAATAAPKSTTPSKIALEKLIGQSTTQITSVFGQPNAKELSEYGFTWYIYNSDYSKFVMIGIMTDKVVGVFSNSAALNFLGLAVGTTRANVRSTLTPSFGQPLTGIQKGNTRYSLSNTDQKDVFTNDSFYATVFYDNIEGGTLTSVQIISKETEKSFGYYGTPSLALASGMEKISFYLANSIRYRRGLAIFEWDDRMATIARVHSVDMFTNNYFSHTNLQGLNSSARFKAAGISYSDCAENIAKNHPSAINAHESFMNSEGHRKNILRNCRYLGVGVCIGNGAVLLTQDFMTYK